VQTICIHQPDFAPHLGFFHRLLLADHYVILDDVQFIRRGWQHRDKIKGKSESRWLTLSIQKGNFHQKINEVLLATNTEWIEDNLNLLCDAYKNASHFDEVYSRVELIYRAGHTKMIDLNLDMIRLALDYFQITIPISYASQYKVEAKSTARLIKLIKVLEGGIYLTGTGSRAYLEETLFNEAGIRVRWQNFNHPLYPQLNGNFEPMLSCLDMIFNCGKDSADILRTVLNEQ
jgi:hypothetical protein